MFFICFFSTQTKTGDNLVIFLYHGKVIKKCFKNTKIIKSQNN